MHESLDFVRLKRRVGRGLRQPAAALPESDVEKVSHATRRLRDISA